MNKSRSRRRKYEDYLQSEAFKKVNRQRWQYNMIGLLVLLLIFILATDAGGCARWLGSLLGK